MRKQGIWIDKGTFIEFSEAKQSLSAEIATRDRSIDFYNIGMALPNPDPVLKKLGKDISVYTDMLSDGFLGGCVTSRKASVKSLEWEIDRGKAKSRQAKDIQKIFVDLDIDRIVGEMLNAVQFGYQPMEVMLNRGSGTGDRGPVGYIYPADIVGKPQRWFVYDELNEPRFKTKTNQDPGEALPPKKFLFCRYEPTYENPYGFAVLSRCFWPLTFKKGGYKFWVKFAEKYGMPWPVGKLPRGLDPTEYDALADILEQMVQDGLAVIPDDSSVEILVAEGKGASGNIYGDMIESCKTEISIAILGQNLTTEVKGGSLAATQGHMQVRDDIRAGDQKIPEWAFNELIKWIYEWNYSERVSEHPKFYFYEEEDVDTALAERDDKLTVSMEKSGYKLTKKYYMKGYGLEEEDIEETTPPSPPAPLPRGEGGQRPGEGALSEFAESRVPSPQSRLFPDQTALDDAIDRIDPAVMQAQMKGVLKPVLYLLDSGKSYEDIMSKLVDQYPDMNTSVIEEMLARAIFVSEMWGRLSAGTSDQGPGTGNA